MTTLTTAAAIVGALCIAGMAWAIWHQRRAAVRLFREYPCPWCAAVRAIWNAIRNGGRDERG